MTVPEEGALLAPRVFLLCGRGRRDFTQSGRVCERQRLVGFCGGVSMKTMCARYSSVFILTENSLSIISGMLSHSNAVIF